jgi:hypothetical protein
MMDTSKNVTFEAGEDGSERVVGLALLVSCCLLCTVTVWLIVQTTSKISDAALSFGAHSRTSSQVRRKPARSRVATESIL